MKGAVALDFGATSARFAAGRLVEGRIEFEVIEQIPHAPVERNGRLEWDLDLLFAFCGKAVKYASATFGEATVGIDTWGVDHGLVHGSAVSPPVCYRDPSHVRAFEELKPHRARLYALTGIQHQPFNTICQLFARRKEDPSLPARARWFVLPDLFAYMLTGEQSHELTQASTTQLLGLDGRWSEEAFDIIGWPVPPMQPQMSARMGRAIASGVHLAHVGSHDTASAVAGFGSLADDQMFLNVGTWSLAGCVIEEPVATPEAEAAMLTNERTVDGRIRLLKNIPGFYVINRLHEELGVSEAVPQWLESMSPVEERIDLFNDGLFNPDSMVKACTALLKRAPSNEKEWAGLALASLSHAISAQRSVLEKITGRRFESWRVGGGGSQSSAFCQALADESGLPVRAGPAEATVLGNLGVQLLASGAFSSKCEMEDAISRSASVSSYLPQ